MLKGLDPVLSPELLYVLAAMGHGDSIVIVDANFPVASVAKATVHGSAIRSDVDAVRALRAILSVLPVDTFGSDPVVTMAVVGDAAAVPEVVAEARPLVQAAGADVSAVERFAFYDLARAAFAVLGTAERRLYGNFIVRKGVIAPGD